MTYSGEKVAQKGRSLGRQDRLGMELDSLDIKMTMLQAHDQTFIVERRDLHAIWQGVAIDDEGMVSSRNKRLWQVGVQSVSIVDDFRGFSMHRLRCADYFGAKGFANDLMAEADSKDGQLPGEMGDDFFTDSSVVGRAGAGTDDDVVRLERGDLLQRALVVAMDAHVLAQFAQVLHEVVGE